jgi:hypothetical protein
MVVVLASKLSLCVVVSIGRLLSAQRRFCGKGLADRQFLVTFWAGNERL